MKEVEFAYNSLQKGKLLLLLSLLNSLFGVEGRRVTGADDVHATGEMLGNL